MCGSLDNQRLPNPALERQWIKLACGTNRPNFQITICSKLSFLGTAVFSGVLVWEMAVAGVLILEKGQIKPVIILLRS